MSSGGYGGPRHVDYGEKEEVDHPVIPGMPASPPPRKEPKKDAKRKDTKCVHMGMLTCNVIVNCTSGHMSLPRAASVCNKCIYKKCCTSAIGYTEHDSCIHTHCHY